MHTPLTSVIHVQATFNLDATFADLDRTIKENLAARLHCSLEDFSYLLLFLLLLHARPPPLIQRSQHLYGNHQQQARLSDNPQRLAAAALAARLDEAGVGGGRQRSRDEDESICYSSSDEDRTLQSHRC